MTIVVDAPELEQVKKQLHKLVNVVRITELDPDESLEREIMMIRVAATAGKRGEILEIGTIFKATAIEWMLKPRRANNKETLASTEGLFSTRTERVCWLMACPVCSG